MPVSQHAQHQGPYKYDRAKINVINYTCITPAVTALWPLRNRSNGDANKKLKRYT